MAKFQAGDRVLVNGGVVATLVSYDEENNRITFQCPTVGGGTDTVSGPLSVYRVQRLVADAIGADVTDDEPEAEAEAAPADEITGTESDLGSSLA